MSQKNTIDVSSFLAFIVDRPELEPDNVGEAKRLMRQGVRQVNVKAQSVEYARLMGAKAPECLTKDFS